MARRMNVVKQDVTKTNHYCGDCGHGVWYFDHANLDVANRLPICCHCPFTPNRCRIRSETACLNWIPKKPGELIVTPDKIVRP